MLRRVPTAFSSLLSYRNPATIICVSLFTLLILGVLDFYTGDYTLIVFYLAPVALSAWFASKRWGLFFCLLVLAARFAIDESTLFFSRSTLHYWNLAAEFIFLVIMSLLFSTLRKTLEKEQEQARIDPLTGAINRRNFFELAEYELNRSRRYKRPFSVVYIDLDNFKQINDRFGHHTGDELLISVVSTIMDNMRNYEILSRFGGDEFVILLPEADEETTLSFLTKIRGSLQKAMNIKNFQVSASMGAVICLGSPPTVDEIIAKADELMYSAKQSGKSKMLHTIIQ